MPPQPAAIDSKRVPFLMDRRREPRFQPPPCERCSSGNTVVQLARTAHVLYIRCTRCAELWSVQKPRYVSDRNAT
jgi:hypothetical protein